MKITNIYKTTAALIFLMVASLALPTEAWGQVTGDKYERVKKYYATVDDGSTDKLQKVFDGDEPDTWWNAVKAGTREIIVDFNEEKELAIIKYHGGGNGQEMALRPLQVKVYFSLDGSSWDDVYNFNEIDRKVMNQTLSIPVKSRKKARYFKLVLVPGKKNDGSDESLALNEMWFYGSDNNEIKIKEPENYPIGTIKHKPAKWYDLRDRYSNATTGDTFSEKEKMFDLKDNPLIVASNLDSIQATHTMIDTIYMHKGTSITLTLPDYLNSNFSIKSYQRWYSFRTGKTFETRYHESDPAKVWDLLTPPTDLGDDVYRLKNGYVGNPLKAGNPAYKMDFYFPTDGQFKEWFETDIEGNTPGRDNNWYVVACDVSTYKDFSESNEGELVEPTLSHRILYYICAVENENNWYPKALKNQHSSSSSSSSDTYLEEYEITMPATRIPNRTNELVALSKDARSYVLPDETKNSGSLTVTIEENTAGISLTSSATSTTGSDFVNLTGSNRCIFFLYPSDGGNTDGTYSVTQPDDGSIPTATILVKSDDYRIARYKLKFVEESRLLSQSMVKEIDNPTGQTDNASWRKLTYRTPKALAESDMYELLTELNFDYNNNFTELDQYRPDEYYPFPMAWSYSSYGFYDGSKATYHAGNQNCAQWGYYAITSDYVECQDGGWGKSFAEPVPLKNSEGNESTYHLYVDASDRAGVIARLPFRENLCPGSELFVSAWVKNARENDNTDNAAILFTIWGIEESGNRVPLYRYQTGQIPSTYIPENVVLSGFASGKNEWMHVYFSFIDDSEIDFDSYEVQLDNNSASTQGGDMYVDDIRVYMARPRASIKQKRIECDKRTMVNFRINWDQLYSRLGGDFVVDEIDGIDFCMLDTLKYREVIPYAERASATQDEIKEAIQASAVWIGNNTEDASNYYNQQYGTLYYKWNFNANTPYDDSDGDCLAADNNIAGEGETAKYAFYRLTENDENYLAVDIQAELVPTRTYWLLIQDHGGTVLTQENFASCFGNPDDNCAMRSKLSVEGQNLVKINGEVMTDENLQSYCIGQSFEFSVDMRAFDDSGDEVEADASDIYFDWFFGSKEEFEEKQANYRNVSLEEALDAFRYYYHDKGDLTGVTEQGDLTETHISLIQHYLEQNPDGEGLNSQLVLYRKTLEIRLLEDGLKLAVIPINPEPDDEQIFCFNPSFLELGANGKAPQVQPGFEYVDYQDANGVTNDAYNPAMRIGLKQIEASKDHAITVNLRNAKFAYGDSDTNKPANYKPEHLGLMDEDGDDNATSKGYIYLVGSDDPAYADLFGEDMHQYVIGTVESLYANPSFTTPDDNKMTIKFNLTDPMEAGGRDAFDPKEGYSYTMHIHVEEKTNGGTSITSSCYGNMNLVMKVVPEYLEWSGTKTSDNWHDDALWKRIPSDRINKAKEESSDYFTDGSNKTEKAYVPMLFTKVIMPKDSKVELYKAGFEGDFSISKNMEWKTERPGHINPPAIVNIEDGQPIYYDMMVYSRKGDNTDMATKPFRVNLCNEIHFEPGAEMMHAELLTYEKAWVDYQLAGGRWYALSSPLKGVVSGDFYTDPSGMEAQEYFTDINWSDDNSRINPSVYQRGWKDANANATMVGVGSGDTGERAIAGNWSAVYNKADEKYDAGTGFSLKVLDLPEGTNNATFRLPKADTKYTYSDGTTATEDIDRNDAHTLHVTDLNAGATTPTSISVTLEANGNNPYYLVGNPFMAHLDMTKFFAGNSNLEPKYWVVDNNSQTVAVGKEEDLTTTDPTGDATVAPLQSFFVQKANNETGELTVEFTQEMQTLGGTGDGLRSANALTITATTTDGRTSRAAVAYDMAASADYEASEDAELFLDSNLGDVPMVYTVAGTMATSINRTSELYNIPLGVYGSKQEMVTLSFGGLNQFSSATLYDAQEQTETPLREGKTVSVPAGTSGRYFLRAGTPTGNEVIARNAFLVYSVGGGKVMVTSSNTPLKDIRVYTMGGAQVRSIQASGMQQEIYLNRGIYLITVSDQDGLQETKKVLVR